LPLRSNGISALLCTLVAITSCVVDGVLFPVMLMVLGVNEQVAAEGRPLQEKTAVP
jgi:hypothetical protein